MYSTIIEGVNIKVILAESVQQQLEDNGLDAQNIYDQFEPIAIEILALKNNENIFILDADENVFNLWLDVQWNNTTDVLVTVVSIIQMNRVCVKKGIRVRTMRDSILKRIIV